MTRMTSRVNRLLLIIKHALRMWRVLDHPRNRSKGSWRGMTPRQLFDAAQEEMRELELEVWLWENGYAPGECGVAGEAADVSAYVAMVADVTKR